MIQRLAASNEPGNFMARKPAMVERLLEETRRLGYGHRTPDFGGHFEQSRREWNDGRDSIAVPIWINNEVIAAINLTWMHKVATVQDMVKAHLPLPRPTMTTSTFMSVLSVQGRLGDGFTRAVHQRPHARGAARCDLGMPRVFRETPVAFKALCRRV